MKPSTILYLLGHGLLNLFRNRLMTVASITTISASIFVIATFYTVAANIEFMMDRLQNNIGIAVFFDEGTTEVEILTIKEEIEARSEVFDVSYISPEKAWEQFVQDNFSGHEDLLAGFEGDNPLKESASLQIRMADIDMQSVLVPYIEKIPGVRHVRQTEEVTQILQSFNSFIRYGSFVLVVMLLIISVFLISNTIRLAIALRKNEINIMKYIGARDSFIKGPFFVEGGVIGLIGTVLPLVLIYYNYDRIIVKLQQDYALISNFLVFMDINEIFSTLVPLTMVIGLGIGIVGSLITVSRHLKV